MLARTCVFSKQSFPTGLCGHHTLSGVNPYKWMAPLLPKLRGHFAEFLHHDYLDLLSILYLTTCVGLGYGQLATSRRCFSWQHRITCFPIRVRIVSHPQRVTDLPITRPTHLHRDNHRPAQATFLRHTSRSPPQFGFTAAHHTSPEGSMRILVCLALLVRPLTVHYRYGNINPLSIDYACRPRLRSRLTQGRLA